MMFRITTIICLLAGICSCKTQNYTPESFEGQMLVFGNEGGFAGTVNEYYLFENGQLFHFNSRSTTKIKCQDLDKKTVDQVFSNFKNLGFFEMELDDPGNLTNYLRMESGEEKHELKWGGVNEEVAPIVKQYYNNLMRIAKTKTVAKE